jgi:phosphopantothenoylcysteine decarboxylase/phosphopantothenate--cysteine ligase
LSLDLKPTTDILATLGKQKRKNQLLIGFALETNNEMENALKKLKNKNLDFIVLNSMQNKNTTFNSDYNKITIIDKSKKATHFEMKTKTNVAIDIVDKIITLI